MKKIKPASQRLAYMPAKGRLNCVTTHRLGGVSQAPYKSFNLGAHVGDSSQSVQQNRALLQTELQLPSYPHWLNQVHGTKVYVATEPLPAPLTELITADASYTACKNTVLAILTADCMPVFISSIANISCSKEQHLGQVNYQPEIALVHCGWRGIAQGILAHTLQHFKTPPEQLSVWLGPCIGAESFEVGEDVFEAMLKLNTNHQAAFIPRGKKWLANLEQIVELELRQLGVRQIHPSGLCTYLNKDVFYSYRRDGQTGRMASLMWFNEAVSKRRGY